jgi:hypothetical protein
VAAPVDVAETATAKTGGIRHGARKLLIKLHTGDSKPILKSAFGATAHSMYARLAALICAISSRIFWIRSFTGSCVRSDDQNRKGLPGTDG